MTDTSDSPPHIPESDRSTRRGPARFSVAGDTGSVSWSAAQLPRADDHLVCGGHLFGTLAPQVENALGTLTLLPPAPGVSLGMYGDYTLSETGNEPADLIAAALTVTGPRGTLSDAGVEILRDSGRLQGPQLL